MWRPSRNQEAGTTTSKSSTLAKNLQMSSIFEGVLDASKLKRFQPNFKHSFLKAYIDNKNNIKDTSPSQDC